jgi:HSP20 family protein
MGALKPFYPFEKPFYPFETMGPDLLKGFFSPVWADIEDTPPMIRVDVEEANDRYLVKADIPGVAREDIRIDVDGDMVRIAAEAKREKTEEKEGKLLRSERYLGTMTRAFTLPVEVDTAHAEAKYDNGVLMLTLPKKANAPSHRVTVN